MGKAIIGLVWLAIVTSVSASDAPEVAALQAYAFAPRNEQSREGVRTDALLVIRDGEVLFEQYAAPGSVDTPHLTWSISKSVLACVLGVAFAEGRFTLDDPVVRFYPPMQAHPQVRIRDLLHWASGLDWQEDYEYAPLKSSVVAMLYTRGHGDMAAFTAAHGTAAAPGERFNYSSGDSNVLAAALRQMVGAERYSDYPWKALFEPLGIQRAVWERDAQGTFVGSSYLYMTARELAKIGQLMLDDGRWQGRQLLPAQWVAFNRAPFAQAGTEPGEAVPGGHWWLNQGAKGQPSPWPDAPPDTFAALGHWGQALYVLPQQKLVVVRFADDRDGSFQHNTLLRHVLAAFAGARP